jgi:hypothetical protein
MSLARANVASKPGVVPVVVVDLVALAGSGWLELCWS